MANELTGDTRPLGDQSHNPKRRWPGAASLWGTVIALIVIADCALVDRAVRLNLLRALLVLAALGEGSGGVAGVLRPRQLAARNGRPYAPAYHGVSQDFGFYNLAWALLLVLAALDPTRATTVIAVAIASYTAHGGTHVLRYFGCYYGGGAPIATRPQRIELVQGLQLIAAAMGMTLFFP